MEELKLFRKIADQYPLLTKEQEVELVNAYREGTWRKKEKALDVLVKSNVRLVISCARKFANRGADVSDLVQEGNIGLQKAIDRFEPSRGLKLSTYATYWVRQAMTRYLKGKAKTVFVPEHMMNAIAQIARFEHDFIQAKGRKPTVAETVKGTGLPANTVAQAKKVSKPMVSMQSTAGEDGTEFGELMSDSCAPSAQDETDRDICRDRLNEILATLTARERNVLRFRYGVCDGKPMSVKECAELFGVTESKVEAVQKKASARLKAA